MMASSTTTPMAMANPPSVMVLMDTPRQSSTITAASSESGMEMNEMNAVRRSSRKRNSTTPTSTPPSSSEWSTLRSEVSMKLAGRNRRASRVILSAASAGFICCNAASSARVTTIVLAWYWA